MRIGIIGAGSLGCTFATLLHRAGHEVEVVARNANLAAIQAGGLNLDGAFGTHTAQVAAKPKLSGGAELVLICTKAQDAARALDENLNRINQSRVLVVQNGLEGLNTVQRLAPSADSYGLLSMIAAKLSAPGKVTVTRAAPSYLGRETSTGIADVGSVTLAAELQPALPVQVINNFRGAQWTKLVINMINSVPAITNQSVQEVIANPTLRQIVSAQMQECVQIGLCRGIHFAAMDGLHHWQLFAIARLPVRLAEILPCRITAKMGVVPNLGSTLQSIRNGRATEIEYLSGAVVREAEALGRSAPINATMTRLVLEIEKGRVSLTPQQLQTELSAPA